MIGPLLVIVLLVRAWTGHGREVPCEAQACAPETYVAQAKEDPYPVAVDLGERPKFARVEIAPESGRPAPIGARSARRPGPSSDLRAGNSVPADVSREN